MTILDVVARRLGAAGYAVVPAAREVRFEDASVLGLVAEFESVSALLDNWAQVEEAFLRRHAAAFRQDLRKAWNIYTILLTPARASYEQRRALVAVEENLQATRKVARSGIATERDIENALGVLLPIRHRVSLSTENAADRVRGRLVNLPSPALESLLVGKTGEEFANALLRIEESE